MLRTFRTRQQLGRSPAPKLNLVSLMDIFTILVFFLLLNSGDVEVLPADPAIFLPSATASQQPGQNPVIRVNADGVTLGTGFAINIAGVRAAGSTIPGLVSELTTLKPGMADTDRGLPVTIMGDRAVPYDVLKKVIATCAAADFTDVSLAVNQVASVPAPSAGATTGQVAQR
ncbi:MAG: biopolymer transporter ExbD [Pseudomonadales bacterium]|nr:biopolymer transporter ExbD [Pseudomonadales bacterium]